MIVKLCKTNAYFGCTINAYFGCRRAPPRSAFLRSLGVSWAAGAASDAAAEEAEEHFRTRAAPALAAYLDGMERCLAAAADALRRHGGMETK